MAGVERACVDFNSHLDNVAISTAGSLLRIWEIDTSKLKDEYLPSAHLAASCTCLKWKPKQKTAVRGDHIEIFILTLVLLYSLCTFHVLIFNSNRSVRKGNLGNQQVLLQRWMITRSLLLVLRLVALVYIIYLREKYSVSW